MIKDDLNILFFISLDQKIKKIQYSKIKLKK